MGISITQAIELCRNAPRDRCVMLTGAPGFAKSSAIRQAVELAGWRYWPLYLATKEAVELQGLPMAGDSLATWQAFEGILPLASDSSLSGTIAINIDDAGQASPSVLKAAIRAVYGDGGKRYIGNHELYPDVRLFGTTNLAQHRAGAHRFETYVSNRVTTVEVEPDAMEWCRWAQGHDVDPSVIGYVMFTKQVTDFDPAKDSFMSPRSLVALSEFVQSLGKAGINGAVLQAVANGTIGEQAGTQFTAFHALAADLPDMDAVLEGKKVKLPTRPEVQYMFISAFIRAAREEHVPIASQLIGRMTEEGSATGFEVAAFLTFEALKGSADKLRGIRTQPALYKWLAEYGKYLP
jgi:hypothetical protein